MKLLIAPKIQIIQSTAIYVYSIVQRSYRISSLDRVCTSLTPKKKHNETDAMFPASSVVPSVSYSPIVGSIFGRPAPLGLATMLWSSVAGGLWVCASRLDLTACRLHVVTGRLNVTFSQ
jgi:hypothetical protein